MIWLLAAHLAIDTLLFAYLCVTVNASLARMERHLMDAVAGQLKREDIDALTEALTKKNTVVPRSAPLKAANDGEAPVKRTLMRPRSMSQAQDMAESEITQRTA
jgi:hypothetical protein